LLANIIKKLDKLKKPSDKPDDFIDNFVLIEENARFKFSNIVNKVAENGEGFPSGQREQTVNLLAYAFVGSNPTPSRELCFCGCSSMVELQPSKLIAWVRFPSPADFGYSFG
jgi:hypothetical protein